VPVYHSQIDDPEHLDPGSLQHHGDNAWAMLKALGDRGLERKRSQEDAGYFDIFGSWLVHYPMSITSGLVLVFGVWVMLAIGTAFRKEFRFRQLRWGLLAVPFTLLGFVLGGYLLSWPLGQWPDVHALEHPFPWPGRLALFLMMALVVFSTLKIFSGRVSACSWMILGWALIFALGILLTGKMPTAAHIALLPLAMFALGSVIDLLRKKSPAPLLAASVLGFAGATFMSMYHYFMLDVVMNFDQSHIKAITFWLMALAVMPMLLAFVRQIELTWQPAKWLLGAIVVLCVVQFFLPGFTPDRPRDMTLMYTEVEAEDRGYIVLESIYQQHDRKYAKRHGFERMEINSGRLGTVLRPVREVEPLGLPGIVVANPGLKMEGEDWLRSFTINPPTGSKLMKLVIPGEAGLAKAWVNGVLALDTSIKSKNRRSVDTLKLVYPGDDPIRVELLTGSAEGFTMVAVTWQVLPATLVEPFMENWPEDARPFLYGPRAEKIQEFEFEPAAPDR